MIVDTPEASTPVSTPASSSTPVSNNLSQEEILKILENNAPAGYKYCLTLVPRESDTLEKILKTRMATRKPTPDATSTQPAEKRHKISMHGAVISNPVYREKIAQTQEKKAKKKKGKGKEKSSKRKIEFAEKKKKIKSKKEEAKDKGKEFRQRFLKEVAQNNDSDDGDAEAEEKTSNSLESQNENLSLPTSLNVEFEDRADSGVVKDSEQNSVETSNSKVKPLVVDEENIRNFYAVYWPKPKAYYWAKLMKVFSFDVEDDANEVEVTFLKKLMSSSDPSIIKWDWPPVEDKGLVDVKLLFAGPASLRSQMLVEQNPTCSSNQRQMS